MGNSSSICADRNALRHFDENGVPIYPTPNNSFSPSNGQITPRNEYKTSNQLYKTTIPVNEQHQEQKQGVKTNSCSCQASTPLPRTAGNNCNNNYAYNDVIQISHNKSNGMPTTECFCKTTLPTTNSENAMSMRNNQTNENYSTTTTTIEYELSSGVAKLKRISHSQIAQANECVADKLQVEPNNTYKHTSRYLPPLLTSTELKTIQENLQVINNFGQNPTLQQQQQRNYSMECKQVPSDLQVAPRDRLGLWGSGNDNELPSNISGQERLTSKKYNKGLAFTEEERMLLGIHGRLPAVVKTEQEQVEHCLLLMDRLENNLDKYIYLVGLSERNERLFYKVLSSDVAKMMPLVYTPTVGLACQKFSLLYQYPKGLFITIKDKGRIYEVLKNWPESDIRAIVVTDGERILGLGDLGANGMGIPLGKLSLYTALAGIKPHNTLPITLDVGTNTQSILDDPLYIGLRRNRVRGAAYDEFLDEFMNAVVRRFGQNCLIQFEDFANANAFRLLSKYRDSYCTFNDDIQGTASVAVAGLCASLKIKNTKLKENTLVFLGAGEAALGIANLCKTAMMREGLSEQEAKERIWMVDSKGLIVKDRPAGGLTEHKLEFARDHAPVDTLLQTIEIAKPSVLIGAAAVGGAFTAEILQLMAKFNEQPIIFALSNPTVKAECTAEEAYTNTEGRCIFASGSPFDPVEYNGKTYYPGQGNNSYIFPGVALGVLCAGMLTIPEEVFLISAIKLAELVSAEDLSNGSLYPPLSQITEASVEIAVSIMEYAYSKGLATLRPEPKNKKAFIQSQMYDICYPSAIPEIFNKNKL